MRRALKRKVQSKSYTGLPDSGTSVRWQTVFRTVPTAVNMVQQAAMSDAEIKSSTPPRRCRQSFCRSVLPVRDRRRRIDRQDFGVSSTAPIGCPASSDVADRLATCAGVSIARIVVLRRSTKETTT
jgi:hypothetical protein